MPHFGQPTLTCPGAEVCAARGVNPPVLDPIPRLIEPDPMPRVDSPVNDPLVPIEHPRIHILRSYERGGWRHERPGTWLRSTALQRIVRIAESLPPRWGLGIFDAWRPLALQADLFDAAYGHPGLPTGFVSEPDPDPASPPPHLTGGTVDLTLTVDEIPLGLGSGFDDFTDRARTDALDAEPGIDRDLRRWLFWSMHDAGFVVLDCEWWHFEYGTRRWAAITGAEALFGPACPPQPPATKLGP